jgi:hypothetical protein
MFRALKIVKVTKLEAERLRQRKRERDRKSIIQQKDNKKEGVRKR